MTDPRTDGTCASSKTKTSDGVTAVGDEVPVKAEKKGTVTMKVKKGVTVKEKEVVASIVPDIVIKSTVDGTVKATLATAADYSVAPGTEVLVIEKTIQVRLCSSSSIAVQAHRKLVLETAKDTSAYEPITTSTSGVVTITVKVGDVVHAGDEVGTVAPNVTLESPTPTSASTSMKVDKLLKINGADVLEGQGILVVKSDSNPVTVRHCYRPRDRSKR